MEKSINKYDAPEKFYYFEDDYCVLNQKFATKHD
jgi:hypothetical protein